MDYTPGIVNAHNDNPTAVGTQLAHAAAAMGVTTVRLKVTEGPDAGRTADVVERRCVVGRSSTADFALSDPKVSAFHLELTAAPGGVTVRDLESRNGTFFGGARVFHAVLPPGATLALGDTRITIEPGASGAAPAPYAGRAFGEMIGQSAAMLDLFSLLARVAPTDLSLLIEGPTGSGKELVARAVHAAGRHARGPFLVLDCAAIAGTLAESVLFGHEKGAFTGADERRAGIFEAADGGTVFIDEIGELPAALQPKLLRVLERREVTRLGSNRPLPVRVRVLSATWRDVRQLINQGRFREDLYHRLAQARVLVPGLSERIDDVPILIDRFLRGLAPDMPGARKISPEALMLLARREYPGNVRELRNVVERAAAVAAGPVITAADLTFERMLAGERSVGTRASEVPEGDGVEPFKDAKRSAVDEFERAYLEGLLARTGNNLSRASAQARIGRAYLRELCRKHGLRDDEG